MISLRTTSRRLLGALLTTLSALAMTLFATTGTAVAQVPKDPPGGAGTTVLPIPIPAEGSSSGVGVWTVVLVAALTAVLAAALAVCFTSIRATRHARIAAAV
jgi:hypothetical protein